MDLNFFSWNVKKNGKADVYQDLAIELKIRNIHVLILQECSTDISSFIPDFIEIKDFALEKGSNTMRIFLDKNSGLIDNRATSYLNNKQRCVVLKTKKGFEFNLVGVHLYSMAGKSDIMQLEENKEVSKNIEEFTQLSKLQHTLIIGDLNCQTFSPVLQSPSVFNAIPFKSVVRDQVNRKVSRKTFQYYYNPMWNIIGDYNYITKTEKISGSYYLDTHDPARYHWSLLDGAIVSSSLMDQLPVDSIEIITKINKKDLVSTLRTGRKNNYINDYYSDHLPITLTLETN